jgi:protein-S-isoprenylcysteine O-methyltransferase Ste14
MITPLQLDAFLWIAWSGAWFAAGMFARRNKSIEGRLIRLQHVVPTVIGFVLIFHDRRHPWIAGPVYRRRGVEWLGFAMTLAGLAHAVWARVHLGRYWSGMITLKEGHRLIRSGPYRLTRHPIYTGFLLAALGSAISAGTGDALIGIAIMVVAYLIKIRREEAVLTREFGDEYAQFRAEVAALVPLVY